MKTILIALFILPIGLFAQTYTNQQLSSMVRTLQTQMAAANSKNATQDGLITNLTSKVNGLTNITAIQNSTISTLQDKITDMQGQIDKQQKQIDLLTVSHKAWKPTWMDPNDFKVINGPTTDSVSIIK